jgi:hypothetical protein
MPYTNVDIFREKEGRSCSKKSLGSLNFMKKMGPKKIIVTVFCRLIQN